MSSIPDLVDRYAKMLRDIYFHPIILILLFFILVCIFYVRYTMWMGIGIGIKEENKKEFRSYVCGHIGIEFLISFIISYFIIALTSADITNYIINCIIAPAIGTVVAVFLDNRFFIKMEKDNGNGLKSTESVDGGDEKDTNININISDYSNYNQKFMPIPKKFHDDIQEKISSVNNTYQKDKNLEKEMKGIMNIINDINDNQQIMAEEFKEVKSDIGTMSETLDTIRVTMMTDKKFKLKSLIYECLNAGFATPEQNDIITSEYHNYKALKGNGDIQELYEKHYIKLDVHD